MADDKAAQKRTPGKADADTASENKVAGSAGDEKDAHFITGTGIRTEEIDGRKVQIMTDRPDNFANDADQGKSATTDDDENKDDEKK